MLTTLFALQIVAPDTTPVIWFGLLGAVALLVLFLLLFIVKQYKRCPSNRILVVYGKVGPNKAAQCLHGGGKFIIPLLQDYAFLHLDPLVIEIPLEGALSLNNIRVNVPSTFTVGISTRPAACRSRVHTRWPRARNDRPPRPTNALRSSLARCTAV